MKFQNMLYNTRKSFLRRVFEHFHERILHFKTLSSIYHDDVGISTINRYIPLCVQFALLPISFYTIRSDFESVQTCYLSIDAIYYFPNNRSSVRIKTFPRNVPNEPKQFFKYEMESFPNWFEWQLNRSTKWNISSRASSSSYSFCMISWSVL